MRVRYTKAATLQLAAMAERSTTLLGKKAARVVGASLRILIEEDLPSFPYRGREGRMPGTRELVLARLPYCIVYRVGTDSNEILAILHQAQEWPKAP
jgi:toxin ParE1/3/4